MCPAVYNNEKGLRVSVSSAVNTIPSAPSANSVGCLRVFNVCMGFDGFASMAILRCSSSEGQFKKARGPPWVLFL